MTLKNRTFMNNSMKKILTLFTIFLAYNVSAKENVSWNGTTSVVNTKVASGCSASN